jgi:hypothetical protein
MNGSLSADDKKVLESEKALNLFLKSDALSRLLAAASQLGLHSQRHTLFLHNSDICHSEKELVPALEIFNRIFVTNWLGNNPRIHALPIGLENPNYLRNGIVKDFAKIQKMGLLHFGERPITLLSSFNISTNRHERSKALEVAQRLGGSLILPSGVSPRHYRYLVANSKYVLSPPGNGPDCHRTWEAIYLGAIPIVKRNSWPSFEFKPPVIVVDEWGDIEKILSNKVVPENSLNNWQDGFWKAVKHE